MDELDAIERDIGARRARAFAGVAADALASGLWDEDDLAVALAQASRRLTPVQARALARAAVAALAAHRRR